MQPDERAQLIAQYADGYRAVAAALLKITPEELDARPDPGKWSAREIVQLQDIVRRVPISDAAYQFALDVVRATRPNEPGASDFVRHWLSWGAGPRAGQYMITGAKARALLQGRLHVTIDDLIAVAPAVLRHRVIPNFNADAEGVTVEQIIQKVLTLVPRGRGEKLL